MKKFALILVLFVSFPPVAANAGSVGGANPRPEVAQADSVGGANPRPEEMPDWAIAMMTLLQIM